VTASSVGQSYRGTETLSETNEQLGQLQFAMGLTDVVAKENRKRFTLAVQENLERRNSAFDLGAFLAFVHRFSMEKVATGIGIDGVQRSFFLIGQFEHDVEHGFFNDAA
jgi:hypothetical protein